MTENKIIEYVQKNAKYFRHGLPGTISIKYIVIWNKILIGANDTRKLVEIIMKIEGIN